LIVLEKVEIEVADLLFDFVLDGMKLAFVEICITV
tara:strand:+ start:584 stop:688 length:105 start_codon:yes stop_codon:yes gene_type:complete